MDPFGLLPGALGFVERLVLRRQRLVVRADSRERMLVSVYPYDESSTAYSRQGVIRIYNGGPGRITVNEAGWEAKDGTRLGAQLPNVRTLEPGSPELEVSRDASKVVEVHDAHGGLTKMYVLLAGDEKPRKKKLPADWIEQVRALAAKDKRHR